jgi:hypothetical protein
MSMATQQLPSRILPAFDHFVSENQEAAMVVTGAQLHPINQFLHLPRLNVKEALYRPIQAAIINILIAQSKISPRRSGRALF